MKPYRIGILLGQKSNSFWLEMHQAYETLAPEFCVDVDYAWPVPGNEEKSQLTQLQKLSACDLHAIIINPLNRYNLSPGILEAADRKIPVLDVGAKADRESVWSAGSFYIPVKTVDFYEQGALGASYIIQRLKPYGGGKVAIIEGDRKSTQSIERSGAAVDIFESAPGILVAARLPADFNRHKAAQVSRQILGQHPDLAAFFCANDDMALGVVRMCKKMGLGNKVIIVGVDLIEEAKLAVQMGQMAASISFSVSDVAIALLRAAINRINGNTAVPEDYTVISRLMDRQSLFSQ